MSAPRVISFGCRLNAHEADAAAAHAAAAGLAGAIIVNTCAVTAEAVAQARQEIRRARRQAPAARLIVTGCAAQIAPGRFAAMPEVDAVVGNAEKMRPETYAALAAGAARVLVGDIATQRAAPQPGLEHQATAASATAPRTRAYVQVQNGCDHRCTFCIIPLGRGPSRSVPADEVVRHVRELVSRGTAEVVLTGVDITSYGGDLPQRPTLGHLVRRILDEVPDLARLRLSSIDQVEVDADLFAALAEHHRLMPHLHLSMQAGDDMILKRMKRRHARADLERFCDRARMLRPDVVFGADVIAGFPTETDAMFDNTLSAVEACGITFLHVFPYSPRDGTPAARMPQVPHLTARERAARLRDAGARALERHLAAQVGSSVEVLVERGGMARTPQFTPMALGPLTTPPGRIVRARVAGHDGRRLSGEVMMAGEVML